MMFSRASESRCGKNFGIFVRYPDCSISRRMRATQTEQKRKSSNRGAPQWSQGFGVSLGMNHLYQVNKLPLTPRYFHLWHGRRTGWTDSHWGLTPLVAGHVTALWTQGGTRRVIYCFPSQLLGRAIPREESNPQPAIYKTAALPVELPGRLTTINARQHPKIDRHSTHRVHASPLHPRFQCQPIFQSPFRS